MYLWNRIGEREEKKRLIIYSAGGLFKRWQNIYLNDVDINDRLLYSTDMIYWISDRVLEKGNIKNNDWIFVE